MGQAENTGKGRPIVISIINAFNISGLNFYIKVHDCQREDEEHDPIAWG